MFNIKSGFATVVVKPFCLIEGMCAGFVLTVKAVFEIYSNALIVTVIRSHSVDSA